MAERPLHPQGLADQRWQQIDALFDAALELSGEQRAELLEEGCGDDPELRRIVERLLAVEAEAEGFLEEPAVARPPLPPNVSASDDPAPSQPSPEEFAGTRIGPYRLIRPIGYGGMGTVYLAQREDDYRQEVAIKLVRRSLLSAEARRRLHAERQVLARLEHPNIARLYDGGATDEGSPYLVMERVQGLPIDRYCDHHRLTVRQRIELIRRVLAAVAHAHHHLRVHCDIKPNNILVTEEGVPKLLDFGIAKLLSPEEQSQITATRTGLRPMTLGYASPEQVLGHPITTASDLYSVGVLLSELICGHLPYAITGDVELEMGRAIVEQDPVPPSRRVAGKKTKIPFDEEAAETRARNRGVTPKDLVAQLQGDLDAIVLKALRKEPGRRYPSAEAFSEDLLRHLEARPVTARIGTWRYRGGRFFRRLILPPDPRRLRERWTWAAAVLALATASGLFFWLRLPPVPCQDSEARIAGVWDESQRIAAQKSFLTTALPYAEDTWNRVEATLTRYRDAWVSTDREICEATLVRGERSPRLLDLGRLCLDGRREELRALSALFSTANRDVVASAVPAASQLGDLQECTDQAELATRRLPPEDPEIRRRLEGIRSVTEEQRLQEFLKVPVDIEALRQAVTELRDLDDPILLSRILHILGLAESYGGDDPELGEAHLEEALFAAIAGGDRPQQARIYAALIKTLTQSHGDFERARFWEKFAVASLEGLSSGYHEVEADVFEALGLLEFRSGDQDTAFEHYLRSLESAESQGDPIQQISALNQLGMFPEGAEFGRRVISVIERELGPEHIRLGSPLMNLAVSLARQGQYEEALPHVRRSYTILREASDDPPARAGYPLTLLGQILTASDRPEEAVEPLRNALRTLSSGFEADAGIVRDAHTALAEALLRIGETEEALQHLEQAGAGETKDLTPNHPSRLFRLHILGIAQREAGDLGRALATHKDLLENLEAMRAIDPLFASKPLLAVAATLRAGGREDEARPLLEEALAGAWDSDRWLKARIRFSLAQILADDDPQRALELTMAARAGLSEEFPLHRRLLREIAAWERAT